ncbi:multi antimicrobial extrusion protein (Na(+)/drug antiporter), MATE family of MDR efflux pumps [Lachnospiraceae bacterium KM106-2]|nr:multi antimicrobial extrusion protein (Na(+)/drug antiporter), MATE family of MDR efflux pumps [Lachnospiraceae bacterium KM106-2]
MKTNISKHFTLPSLIWYTLPSMIMMIFMSIYTIADGVIVSQYLGDSALSALNIVYPVIFLVNGIGVMLGTGGSAIIAKKIGEGDIKSAREHFSFFVFSSVLITLVITIITVIFQDPIIRLLGANDALLAQCKAYLMPSILFASITVLQLLFQCYFSTAGKPNYSLILTIAGGLINIVLDLLFLGRFNFGISGAAIATILGQSILAAFGLLYFFTKKNDLHFTKFQIDIKSLLQACFNGSSEMVSNLANAVVTFLFNIIMMKLAGESGVAAITIILYGQFLFNSLYLGFSIGVSPIISYQYGAKNKEELQNITRISLRFLTITSILILGISLFSSDWIVGVFVKSHTKTYALAAFGFSIFAINYLFSGLNIFCSGLFTALSDGKHSAILSFLRTFFWMIVSLLLLPNLIGITGVWIAVPVAEFSTLLLSLYFLITQNKRYHYLK